MRALLAGAAAAAGLALSIAGAAGPDIRISELSCVSHPEWTKIKNIGDAPQDLAGWRLFSPGPPSDESHDLGRVGVLNPGQEVWIFIGHLSPAEDPSRAYYVWIVGPEPGLFILDDGDPQTNPAGNPNDSMQVLDPQGNVRAQANCGGQPVAFPAPTPPPAEQTGGSPVESVASTPASDVGSSAGGAQTTVRRSTSPLPGGGGPPPQAGALDSLALALGAAAMAGGALSVTLGLRHRR